MPTFTSTHLISPLQATVTKLWKEAEATPDALIVLPPKTMRERLLECWPSRQTYAHRTNMLEHRILPLFASIWLQPGVPTRVLLKVLCALGVRALTPYLAFVLTTLHRSAT